MKLHIISYHYVVILCQPIMHIIMPAYYAYYYASMFDAGLMVQ